MAGFVSLIQALHSNVLAVVRVLGTSARVRFADGDTHDVAFDQLLRITGSYEP